MSRNKPRTKGIEKDVFRLAKKSAEANVGEYLMSEASAVSAYSIIPDYYDKYFNQKSNAGSAKKLKEGILLATLDVVKSNPGISSRKAWDKLGQSGWESDDLKWEVYRDGERLVQVDYSIEKGNKESSISFDTFRTEYLPKAKEKVAEQ